MKHILYHKLDESIGKGSVLLIKSKPINGEIFLFATQITGYVNIRPRVTMVFLGDELFRVVHKGDSKFSGKRISYGHDAIRDVLNMKDNQTTPSIVLNNNKTPFHWVTLQHTDIGSALREVEQSLINMDSLNLT